MFVCFFKGIVKVELQISGDGGKPDLDDQVLIKR